MGSSSKLMFTPKKAQQGTPRKLLPTTPRSVRSPYMKAKKVLTVSAGETLVGRDEEFNQILNIVQDSLEKKNFIAVYVSGPAGTGKTLTVNSVVENLESKHNFKRININCMSFESLANFYEQISCHYKSSPKKQRNNISNEQNELSKIQHAISQHHEMTVMVLDEVDQLKSKNNEVLRNIFKLPSISNNKLILIGVSNALDFTSKMVWIKELDKSHFREFRFMPYNKEQIVQIIDHRLNSSKNEENSIIDKFALEYCARKIASCSGDIRKALDVCRRAIEMVESNLRKPNIVRSLDFGSPLKPSQNQENINCENNTPSNHVNLTLMMNALNKVYGGVVDKLDIDSKVHLPSDQQLILCTLLLLLKFKSMREVKLSDCRQLLAKICTKKGISTEGKSETDILTMCQLLADYGYLSIKNDSTLVLGRSPSKLGRTPTKKKPVILSLRIDPVETEQLLSTFHKSIVSNGVTLIC